MRLWTLAAVALALNSCADPGPTTPQQVANTYQSCPGALPDGGTMLCLRDGWACPSFRGDQCVMLPVTMTEAAKRGDGGTH
jgi:hypothetical protein